MKKRNRSSRPQSMPTPATKPKPRIASELIAIGAMFFWVFAEWLVMVGAGVAVALTLKQVVSGVSSDFLLNVAIGMPLLAAFARRISSILEKLK